MIFKKIKELEQRVVTLEKDKSEYKIELQYTNNFNKFINDIKELSNLVKPLDAL